MSATILAEIIGPDLLIVLLLALVLFGGARLPKLARSLGSAKTEFEKGLREPSQSATPAPRAGEEPVTMTQAELDALLAQADERGRKPNPTPPTPAA